MSIQLAYIQNINIAFFNFFYRIPPPKKKNINIMLQLMLATKLGREGIHLKKNIFVLIDEEILSLWIRTLDQFSKFVWYTLCFNTLYLCL